MKQQIKRISYLTMLVLTFGFLFMVSPVAADEEEGNMICEVDSDGNLVPTDGLGSIMDTVIGTLVTVGFFAMIFMTVAFQVAGSLSPGGGSSNTNWNKRRNQVIKYGFTAIIGLYLGVAVVAELGSDQQLDFSCILPFA